MIKNLIKKSFISAGYEIKRIRPEKIPKYSNFDEEIIIDEFLTQLKIKNKYCIDIGANDGISMSNSYKLYKNGWKGVAFECDKENFPKLAFLYKDFPEVNLNKCKITPENVNLFLKANGAPKEFDFLNLDIDSYDYFVLEQILTDFRPMLICSEINEKIPPPLKFTVLYDPNHSWKTDHFYGQSISQLYSLCRKFNYDLVRLEYCNAFLIAKESNIFGSLTPDIAYKNGYLERPDRKDKFPWNKNMEELLYLSSDEALRFINEAFSQYKGKYICTL